MVRVMKARVTGRSSNRVKLRTVEKRGVRIMENVIKPQMNLMAQIANIARKAIKEKGLSEEEVRKSLGVKRYEK